MDIGNGPCSILNFINAKIKVGIDPNNLLYKQNKILFNLNKDIIFITSPSKNTTLLDESFDLILCINVLDHTTNPKKVIREILKILKPKERFSKR